MSDRNDSHDDRLGLDAFDQVDPPDQWDDITRRAQSAGLESTDSVAQRRPPATWLMAAAAVALVAAGAVAISARTGDDSAPTPATTPDETLPTPDTEPPTTPTSVPATPTTVPGGAPATSLPTVTPDSTPTTAPATVVPGAVVEAWEPDCVERFGDGSKRYDLDPSLSAFSTLGEEPSLDIALPKIETVNGVVPPLLTTAVVPGGVAMAMHEYVGGDSAELAIVVVDADGSLRWRRCLTDTGGTSALIVAGRELWVGTNGEPARLRGLDLSTGADFSVAFEVGERMIQDTEGSRLLTVKPWTSPIVEVDDRLGLIDLDAFTAGEIPYPALAVGDAPDAVRYEVAMDGGDLLVAGTSLNRSTPDLVWTGESWSSEPDDLRRLPPTLRLPFGVDDELRLLDGSGDVVWSVPGFRGISREGFNSAITDSVVLVMECLTWTDDLGCQWVDDTPPEEQLAAFDLETGERLWARPGGQSFAAIDGDRGIVTAEEGWELIDLRTGGRVDDQPVAAWSESGIWANECCGAGDYVWTRLDGGVLFESLGDRLRVWLPPELSSPTASVDLFE